MTTDHAHSVMLCLASNSQQERNMEVARGLLSELLADLRYTSEHWTEPVNSARTDMYLNQLATGRTELSVEALNLRLKKIEQLLGRKHDKSGIVTIDIDLLLYDEARYHLRDWERDYVKNLLVEL